MRWDALISLLSDGRVQFLLCFVIVAFILAGVLALIEFRLKREKERAAIRIVNELAIGKIRRFLKSDKTPREKLDFIDKSAKEYFKENYKTSLNSSYSALIEEFEKAKRNDEIAFCKLMFETYYSSEKLTEKGVVILGNLLIGIEKSQEDVEKVSHVPTPIGQINQFFEKRKLAFLKRKAVSEERMFRSAEKKKKTDVLAKQEKEKMLVVEKEKEQRLKFERDKIIELKRERRKEKIKTYRENTGKLLRGTIDKLSAFFGAIKILKDKIFTRNKIVSETYSIPVKKEVEISEEQLGEYTEEKSSGKVDTNREGTASPIGNNFSFNIDRCAPATRRVSTRVEDKQNFLQNQATNSGEFSSGANTIKEGIAERIIRKEKERLEKRDIFAVEI